MAIENVNTIDEHNQKSLETEAIENIVSSNFDPRSVIVKSVLDCRLSGVNLVLDPKSFSSTSPQPQHFFFSHGVKFPELNQY